MQEALPAKGLISQNKTQDRMIPQQVAAYFLTLQNTALVGDGVPAASEFL